MLKVHRVLVFRDKQKSRVMKLFMCDIHLLLLLFILIVMKISGIYFPYFSVKLEEITNLLLF